MPSDRRDFLERLSGLAGVTALTSISGCSLPGGLGQSETDETATEREGEIGKVSLPVPELASTSIPNVTIQSVNTEEQSGGEPEHIGVFNNMGGAGDVIVHMYWKKGDSGGGDAATEDELEFADSTKIEMESEDSKSITFTGEIPSEYDGVWMIVSPGSVTATIRNTGETGDVDVVLIEDGEKDTTKTVTVESDATKSVTFTRDFVTDDVSFNILVRVAD